MGAPYNLLSLPLEEDKCGDDLKTDLFFKFKTEVRLA